MDLADEPLPDQTEGKTEEEQTEPASAKEDLIAETDVSTNHDPAEVSAETKEPEESLVLEDSATQEDVLK